MKRLGIPDHQQNAEAETPQTRIADMETHIAAFGGAGAALATGASSGSSAAAIRGGGEMGDRMRSFDWSASPIGPMDQWPRSLKTAVHILLNSRYPMFIWWGRECINIYNDAYIPLLGSRHPAALGRPASQSWSDIWSVVGPQAELVLNEGQATWNEAILLTMERRGYREETYFTWSYSPAPDDDSNVGGVFCAVTEDTARVLSERRLQTLRNLGERALSEASTSEEACRVAGLAIRENQRDFAFASIYLLDEKGEGARLCESINLPPGSTANPLSIPITEAGDIWSFREVIATKRPVVVHDIHKRFGVIPAGEWTEDVTRTAVVLPIVKSEAAAAPAGFLVAGVSPRLELDDAYHGFLELVARQIATALARARAYEEERKRAESLAELDRAKTLFFSNVSHEFRTPLTLMLGPLEQMRADTGLSPEQGKLVEVAHRNSVRLLKLVNSLLDFSRIEAGRIKAAYVPVDLAPLTVDLCSNFRAAMDAAGLKFDVDCPPLREPVFVDREMWEKIVLNLVSNAFKFTFEGRVAARLQAIDRRAVLTVSDTGVGIPEPELSKIFERFHRVEGSRGRTFEGTGIGLALVQELVKLHGGTVQVRSRLGEGTTFTVSLPFGSAHLPPDRVTIPDAGGGNAVASTAVRSEAFTGEALTWIAGPDFREPLNSRSTDAGRQAPDRPRVLLADDNSDMRDYVSHILGAEYDLVAVPDGRSALAAAHRARPDLVLSDVMMPQLDGFGLLRELRADEELRNVPVIFISARAGDEARTEGVAAGADDYLTKPFSARELLARVRTHIELAQRRRQTESALRASELLISSDLRALRRIQQVRMRLIGSDDLHARLSEILDAAADLIAAPKGNIQLYDPKSDVLRILVQRGFGDRFLHRFLNRGSRLLCDVAARKNERVIWEDVAKEPALQGTGDLDIILEDGIRAIQSTPLVSLDGRLLGLLNNHFPEPHRPSERDLGYLDLLARMAADFIERWHSELALRESEARFRALAMASSDVVYRMSADWKEMLNLAGREFIADTVQPSRGWLGKYIHPEDQPKITAAIDKAIRSKSTFELEHRVLRVGGSLGWALSRAVPILDEAGNILEWFGTAKDVTERKEAEEKLRETQRLESLGVLAGGIAHDFNNLLTGVLGNASLLDDEFPIGSPQSEIVRGLTDAAERMSRLTSQMLAYSGRGHFVVEIVDVSRQVIQITNLIHASIPKSVELRLSLANGLPPVEADISQLQQVVMNLVINAAESIAGGKGTVEVRTCVERVGDEELSANIARTAAPSGDYVVIAVKDTGCGMDEATRARIFDPFFTTKFTGRGLGLSSVLGIVRGHNGLITVRSHPGAGTVFRVFFPISTVAGTLEPEADRKAHGSGTVLVVDDEDVVRGMAKTALQRLGYSVLTAVNGKEALDIYLEDPDRIDIILLDMAMPVMGGEETLKRIREIRPEATVLAMSGFQEREAMDRFGTGIVGFVQKPFTARQLGAKLMAARRGSG